MWSVVEQMKMLDIVNASQKAIQATYKWEGIVNLMVNVTLSRASIIFVAAEKLVTSV